jgi:hypothetical protein
MIPGFRVCNSWRILQRDARLAACAFLESLTPKNSRRRRGLPPTRPNSTLAIVKWLPLALGPKASTPDIVSGLTHLRAGRAETPAVAAGG